MTTWHSKDKPNPGDRPRSFFPPGAWYGREGFWLLALLALTLGLRLVWLDRAPPGVRFDELVNVKMADHIYAGEWPIYFQEAWGHEPLYHYFHAAGMALLGKTVLGVRIASILFGTLGVFTTYMLFRLLFGRNAALLTAVMLTTSLWSLMYSRIGLRHISLPPWIGLAAYCFWRGLRTPTGQRAKATLWFALGGLSTGATLYTYFAGRVVPAIWLVFALYLILFHRPLLKGRWPGLLVFLLLPAIIVAPMVIYLSHHPELEQRLGQVGGELVQSLRAGNTGPLCDRVLETLSMFGLRGDPEWLYNISGRPVFDPLTLTLFAAGVLLALWRWRDPRYAFLLIWLIVGIAPAMLSWPSGSLGHAIVAQPVTFCFPALALAEALRRSEQYRGTRLWLKPAARALVFVVPLAFALINGYDYFVRWPAFREVRHEYQAPITAIARYLRQHPEVESACVSAPYVDYWNPWSKMSFDLFYRHDEPTVRWFNGMDSILFPADGEALFFLPDHLVLPSTLDANLGELLMSGSQAAAIGYRDVNGSTLDIYRWQDRAPLERRLRDIAGNPLWASPEGPYVPGESERQRYPLSLPLDFGHRLALLGYTYEQDLAAKGTTWNMTTYWRVSDASSQPLVLFVHLLDQDNQVKAGWDALHVSTQSWIAGDIFAQVHTLQVPPDVPGDTLRVELGVYSPVTLERLFLYTSSGENLAPYNRALLRPLSVQ